MLASCDDKRLSSRLRQARLHHNACLEYIDYRSPRGLGRALNQCLADSLWLHDGLNLIFGGPAGWAKPYWLTLWLTEPAGTTTRCASPS